MGLRPSIFYNPGDCFGALTVVKELPSVKTGKNKTSRRMFLCRCICGNETNVYMTNLRTGKSKSCSKCSVSSEAKAKQHKDKIVSQEHRILRKIINMYKKSASSRNLEYTLTDSEISKLIALNCYYCDKAPENQFRLYRYSEFRRGEEIYDQPYIYGGIDRVDSTKGYITSNCVPCCITCNRAKSNKSLDYFMEWIRRICQKNSRHME